MKPTADVLAASGLADCWAAEYDVLRPERARTLAVQHTRHTLALMPAAYRHAVALALRLFPTAFYAVTRHRPQHASPEAIRQGMSRLRRTPGYAQILRATTALALYGALDGTTPPKRTGGKP